MTKHKCACGDEFETRTEWIIHIITLGCYDRNLVWKDLKEKEREEIAK